MKENYELVPGDKDLLQLKVHLLWNEEEREWEVSEMVLEKEFKEKTHVEKEVVRRRNIGIHDILIHLLFMQLVENIL